LTTELYNTIALLRIEKVGDITARELIAHCGSAEAVFRASRQELLKIPNIGATIAENVKKFDDWKRIDAEMQFLDKNDISASLYHEKNYPQRLIHFADSPTIVYRKGDWDANKQQRIVGIIGTRKPTHYGIAFTEKLVAALQAYNVTVISGLAYGIDGVAHRSALENKVPTVGVLAHGLQKVYPPAHEKMAQRMWQEGGALLTEFPSGTEPDRENFPRRNRIVAGLCDCLVVAETAYKGGSMITANIANEYNKDVFALPGRVNEGISGGCNLLIKSHKAALLESIDDLVYVMRWNESAQKPTKNIQSQLFLELSGDDKIIADALADRAEHAIDALAHRTAIPMSRLSALLLSLEFSGLVRSLPGKRYALV
jgi:DNA processing protein